MLCTFHACILHHSCSARLVTCMSAVTPCDILPLRFVEKSHVKYHFDQMTRFKVEIVGQRVDYREDVDILLDRTHRAKVGSITCVKCAWYWYWKRFLLFPYGMSNFLETVRE